MEYQWTMWEQLNDLEFADEKDLLSHTQTQMQEKTERLSQIVIKLGLTRNITKTRVMKILSKIRNPIFLNSTALEEV